MPSQQNRSIRVLYVEDKPINLLIVERILRSSGYDFIGAEDGATGIELTLDVKPDIILMDIQLPDMSGFEVVKRIRSNPLIADIPIIAVSAYAYDIHQAQYMSAGCDGYLAKPIHRGELLNAIEMFTYHNQL